MEQFLNFVMQHWLLWALFFVLLAALIGLELRGRMLGFARLQPSQVVQHLNHDNAVVLDLRDANAFAGGHILGSIHVEAASITNENAQKRLKKYKTKPVILVGSDQQITKVGQELAKLGFTNINMLQGGISAWRTANLPLVNKK